jgi:hypothetical protein
MSLIDEIARVNITMADLGVTTASYDTMLIIGSSNTLTQPFKRVATYGSLSAVKADFADNTPEYAAANAAFSQVIQPVRIKIGQLATVENSLEAYDVAYNAIKLVDNAWYGVVITSRLEADQLLIANATAADNKIFGISSADTNCLVRTDHDNIAYKLFALKSDRNFCAYSSVAGNKYPEAGEFGLMLSYPPGSANWAHRQIQNIQGDNLSDDARATLEGINCNFIASFAGRNVFFWGKAASGQYLDIVMGRDWLKTTIQDRVATVLQSVLKVEYTDVGVEQITTAIRTVLEEAASNGFVDKNTIKVTAPLVASVSPENKANRILPDIYFEAVLSGAVNKVQVQGVLSI